VETTGFVTVEISSITTSKEGHTHFIKFQNYVVHFLPTVVELCITNCPLMSYCQSDVL